MEMLVPAAVLGVPAAVILAASFFKKSNKKKPAVTQEVLVPIDQSNIMVPLRFEIAQLPSPTSSVDGQVQTVVLKVISSSPGPEASKIRSDRRDSAQELEEAQSCASSLKSKALKQGNDTLKAQASQAETLRSENEQLQALVSTLQEKQQQMLDEQTERLKALEEENRKLVATLSKLEPLLNASLDLGVNNGEELQRFKQALGQSSAANSITCSDVTTTASQAEHRLRRGIFRWPKAAASHVSSRPGTPGPAPVVQPEEVLSLMDGWGCPAPKPTGTSRSSVRSHAR